MIKKLFVTFTVSALLVTTTPVSASAHCRNGNSAANQNAYALCTVENCYNTNNHDHNGATYSGHYDGDGHGHNSSHNNRRHHQ